MRRHAFLGGAAALLAAGSAVPSRAATFAKVRIGTVPIDSYGQPYYGDAAGIFTANGIDVEITGLANSGAIAAAMLGGAIDVGIGSPVGIAQARMNGVPFVFFAPGPLFSIDVAPTSMLMVAKDGPIKTAGDLVGKTIAVDLLKSMPQIGTMLWLEKNGVDPASVKWLELPFSSMPQALVSGRIDAGTLAEPALSASRATCRPLANYSSAIAPHYYSGAWFTTEASDQGQPAAGAPGRARGRTHLGVEQQASERDGARARAHLEDVARRDSRDVALHVRNEARSRDARRPGASGGQDRHARRGRLDGRARLPGVRHGLSFRAPGRRKS